LRKPIEVDDSTLKSFFSIAADLAFVTFYRTKRLLDLLIHNHCGGELRRTSPDELRPRSGQPLLKPREFRTRFNGHAFGNVETIPNFGRKFGVLTMLQPELGRDRTMLGGGLLVDLDLPLSNMDRSDKIGDFIADRLEFSNRVHWDFLCGDKQAQI
jgi:hypothetical protein